MTLRPWKVFFFALLVVGGTRSPGRAQSLILRQVGNNSERIVMEVNQTIIIEVLADVQGATASGFVFFISVPPNDVFQVFDAAPNQPGVQPFERQDGFLFLSGNQRAGEQSNLVTPSITSDNRQILELSAVLGGGGNRAVSGSGVIARFRLRAVGTIANGRIDIVENPIQETRLVLPDGSARRFRTQRGLEITVTGLQLRDIPDVILQPGQSDSTQIGVLDNYLGAVLTSVDSIRWTVTPADLDSVDIEIDPVTRRVRITPAPGWTGTRTVVFTATEAQGILPGLPPLSSSDQAIIVVNNPPRFLVEPDSDGVKRDTIRFLEDQHPFVPGGPRPDPGRAFRVRDFSLRVQDPDVLGSLRFGVSVFGAFDNLRNLSAEDDEAADELRVWARPDFAGVDSFKVLVDDGLRGRDSLRVIVEVGEVPDPPMFLIAEELRIGRGGERVFRLDEFVEDPDTPLDSLALSWQNDREGHFSADTLRTAEGLTVVIRGEADFAGRGRIDFAVRDPADPDRLFDTLFLFVEAAEALPPDIFPPETKINLVTGGDPATLRLDDFVDDPDNSPGELSWILPQNTRTQLGIDEQRLLSALAPFEFVGFEDAILKVLDPAGQADSLKLRIYASDGRPVVGGLPDLVLDAGDLNQDIDLDDFFFDADNSEDEMDWRALGDFDQNNLSVEIDPFTHIVSFRTPETAALSTETVIFEVTSRPEGISDQDTMLVSIRSGGLGGGSDFRLLPVRPLEVQVMQQVDALDLDEIVSTTGDISPESLQWEARSAVGLVVPTVLASTNVLKLFGISAGLDTLTLTARDSLGQTRSVKTTVRVFGENEALKLQALPDIQFIAGQAFTGLNLNQFIIDRETHPDSVIEWTALNIGPDESVTVNVLGDSTVFIFSAQITETGVVFVARDTRLDVTGRDTVRVLVLDPNEAAKALKAFPPLVLVTGEEDSSLVLNDFLPDEVVAANVRWSVSGQSITRPFISPTPPHRLSVGSVGARVGVDTLQFTADLGGGFTARGSLVVEVVEPVDESTLELQVLANPLNPRFIDLFVIARRPLSGTPNVVRQFDNVDSVVAVRQIEDNLAELGVLVWAGNIRLRPGASGIAFFRAQALTALNTPVEDTTSLAIATTAAGKPTLLRHRGVEFFLPADALEENSTVLLQAESRGRAEDGGELRLHKRIHLYPLGRVLEHPGALGVGGSPADDEGIYQRREGRWIFVGPAADRVAISRLGDYGMLRDVRAPSLRVLASPALGQDALVVEVRDGGSGVDAGSLNLRLDGEEVRGDFQQGRFKWIPGVLAAGAHELVLRARDRAGNQSQYALSFARAQGVRPRRLELGANYPNPFNPETTIPFSLAAAAVVRLRIYNMSGQLVRELLNERRAPGRYEISWDGRDRRGIRAGSGVYLYRLESGTGVRTRKMTLLK